MLGNAGFNTSSVDGISRSNIASAKTTSNVGQFMSSIGDVSSNLGPIGMAAGTALKTFGGVFSASANNKLAREQQRIMTKTKLDTENELIRQEHLNDEDVNNNYIAGKFGSNFKCGGKIKAKCGGKSKLKLGALGINTKDGNAISIPSNTKQMFLLRGKSHEEGGIKQGKNLEVEDGEVEYLSNDGKTLNVLSDQSYLTRRGISPADLAIITGNPETAMKEQESVKSQLGIKDSKYKAGKGKKYVIKEKRSPNIQKGTFEKDLDNPKDSIYYSNYRVIKDKKGNEKVHITLPDVNSKKYIVLHHTGSSAKNADNTFMNPNSKLSSHYLIDKYGNITKYANDDEVTYHAGLSRYNKDRTFNNLALGIEFEGDTNNEDLTEDQYGAGVSLVKQLASKYNIPETNILSHKDITKLDNGNYRKVDISDNVKTNFLNRYNGIVNANNSENKNNIKSNKQVLNQNTAPNNKYTQILKSSTKDQNNLENTTNESKNVSIPSKTLINYDNTNNINDNTNILKNVDYLKHSKFNKKMVFKNGGIIKANDGLQTKFDFLSTDDIINKINNQWNNYKDRNPLNENLNFSINNNVKLPDYSLSKRRSNVDYISLLNANKDNNKYPLANVDVSLLQQARKLGNDYPTAPVIGQNAEQYNEELKSYINNKTIVKNAIPKNPALLEVKPKTAIKDTDKVLHEKEYIIPQIPNREAELQPEKTISQIEKEQSDKLKIQSLMNIAPYMSSATESLLNYGINNSEIKSRLQPNAPIYDKAVINNANVNINDQLANANNTFRKNQGIIYANSVNSKAAASRLINANSITDAAKQAAYKNKYDTEKQIRESNQVNATNIINLNNQLVHKYLNDVRDFKNTQNEDIAKNKVNLNKNINALVHDIDKRKQTLKKEQLDRAITIGTEAGTNNNSMTYFLGTSLFDENTPEGYNNTLAYYNSIKDNNDENSILMKNKLKKKLNIQ